MAALTHALLLSAGLGTRLRPLTLVRAKPALPVAGQPMARRTIRGLAAAGITDVVLNLHHLPHTIAAAVGDGTDLGVRARYSWEQPIVLGSAGGPRQALDIVGAARFVIVNGDTLTDLPLPPLEDAHARSGALVTLAVVPNTQPNRYSGLRVGGDGIVTGVEPRGSATASWHFIGVQVAEREAFAPLPLGRPLNSIGETYDALIAARPGSIRAHFCDASFWDIGTVSDYWRTSRAFADRDDAPPASGPRHASVVDSIVWDDVQFGDGCQVERCIVTDGVAVACGARHADAILMRGADGQTVAVPFSVEQA